MINSSLVMAGQAIDRCPFGIVARQAPPHLQRCLLRHHIHFFHRTMALLALKLGHGDMNLVTESDEVGQVVDLYPLNRFVVVVMLVNLFDVLSVGRHHLVTAHAGIQRGNTTGDRAPSGTVAVLAGNLAIASMKFVTEGDRLGRRVAHIINRVAGCPEPPTFRW